MRVLVCPQEFKGSLTAREAAEAIRRGVAAADPSAAIDMLPLSDGGPGFIDALHAALPSDLYAVPCRDPLGRAVEGALLVAGDTVFLEAAQANGLGRLSPGELAPLVASTAGVGDLISAALDVSPASIVIGVGGSATNDGGSGMATALGARFLDANDEELPRDVPSLAMLSRIAWGRPSSLRGVDIVVATDVRNPLLGPAGAAAVFGPQKGAGPAEVRAIEAALTVYARVVESTLGVAVAELPGAGAAGGLAAGLVAFLGARISSGFDTVAAATALEARMAEADLIITGEGRYDAQSSMGKVTGRVKAFAEAARIPCLVLAGTASPAIDADAGVRTLAALAQSPEDSMARAAGLLEAIAAVSVRDR